MKKKVLALALAVVLTMGMSMTAFAASSSSSSNSGSSAAPAPATKATVESAAPGQVISTDTVAVAVAGKTTSLTAFVAETEKEVVNKIAAETASAGDAGAAISQMMSAPATPMFQETIKALNGKAAINNCGTVKTKAAAKDAFGNTIASAGTIKGITSGSLVMLMSVNADGTIEYVEGVVDPVTGLILGAFKGAPKTITVMVVIPA